MTARCARKRQRDLLLLLFLAQPSRSLCLTGYPSPLKIVLDDMPVHFVLFLCLFPVLLQPFAIGETCDQDKKNRHHKYRKSGGGDHPAKYRPSDRTPAFCRSTGGKGKRQ